MIILRRQGSELRKEVRGVSRCLHADNLWDEVHENLGKNSVVRSLSTIFRVGNQSRVVGTSLLEFNVGNRLPCNQSSNTPFNRGLHTSVFQFLISD